MVSLLSFSTQLAICALLNDVITQEFKDIQKNQNKLLRYLNNTRISDMISTKSILEKFNLLSVNQLNAQIKLCDIWKAVNVTDYPT